MPAGSLFFALPVSVTQAVKPSLPTEAKTVLVHIQQVTVQA